VLNEIEQEAQEADYKAMEACRKSKYSIQDYWLCIEFKMQTLYTRIAKRHNLPNRCKKGEFQEKVATFRRNLDNFSTETTTSDPRQLSIDDI
jgi:hypothetical protein